MADLKAKPAAKPYAKPTVVKGSPPARRNFFSEVAAVMIGGIVAVFPFAAGLAPFLDPLRRSGGGAREIRVTSLDAVPDDGIPRRFPVSADLTDAWNKFPNEPIGAVYLTRQKGSNDVHALNAICPHAGCFVGYDAADHMFQCPCHTSAFDLKGVRLLEISQVPPRDMDKLVCQVRDGSVYVAFQNFHTGLEKQVAKA